MAYPSSPAAGAPFTDTGALSNLIKVAYDQRLSMEFSAETILRSFADKKVINQTQPGAEVIFSIHKKMTVNKTPLNEVVDGNESVLDNPKQVSVKVNEHGNYTIYTEALQQFAFDDALAANVMSTIKTNQLETLDALVGDVLIGANIRAAGTEATTEYRSIVNGKFFNTIALADAEIAANGVTPLSADALRDAVAELRSDAVPTWDSAYVAVMHPRVSSKFRAITDAAGWREANTYVNTTNLINGEVGMFEGVRIVENPRVPVEEIEGVEDIYNTFIFGREALAELVSKEPSVIVDGDIVDPYGRKTAVGWYGILGWNLFRAESLYTVKSTLVAVEAPEA